MVSTSYPCAPSIIASFARMFRCETRTPLGWAIAPDVYWMIASVLPSISVGFHADARSSGTVSTSPHSKPVEIRAVVEHAQHHLAIIGGRENTRGSAVVEHHPQPRSSSLSMQLIERVRRHRGHAGIKATEERRDELEPAREQQHHPLASTREATEPGCQRARSDVDVMPCEGALFRLTAGQVRVRSAVRSHVCAQAHKINNRSTLRAAGDHRLVGAPCRRPWGSVTRYRGEWLTSPGLRVRFAHR